MALVPCIITEQLPSNDLVCYTALSLHMLILGKTMGVLPFLPFTETELLRVVTAPKEPVNKLIIVSSSIWVV
jgi:hypothetical protein